MVQQEMVWKKDRRERKGEERENYSEKNPRAMGEMNGGESLHAVYSNNIIFMRIQ